MNGRILCIKMFPIAVQSIFKRFCSKLSRNDLVNKVEVLINKQIQSELSASYTYCAISFHFGKSSVAMKGCQKYFWSMYKEEQSHARQFYDYLLMRNGSLNIWPIHTYFENNNMKCFTIMECMKKSLEMERNLKQELILLKKFADESGDYTTSTFTEEFIKEQDKSINEVDYLMHKAKITGDGKTSDFLFDLYLLNDYLK